MTFELQTTYLCTNFMTFELQSTYLYKFHDLWAANYLWRLSQLILVLHNTIIHSFALQAKTINSLNLF